MASGVRTNGLSIPNLQLGEKSNPMEDFLTLLGGGDTAVTQIHNIAKRMSDFFSEDEAAPTPDTTQEETSWAEWGGTSEPQVISEIDLMNFPLSMDASQQTPTLSEVDLIKLLGLGGI